jgi:hypothetical protein
MMVASPSGRYLLDAHGEPFFWLGDTAWLLFQATTRDDAERYLRARARQGFSVIQAALVMGEERVAGTLRPNAYGDLAFVDGDPARPNVTAGGAAAGYWAYADSVVELARACGLTLALVPLFVASRGDGFAYLTAGNAQAYGRFLGRRYRGGDHIVWVLGGDNVRQLAEKRDVWHALARGIAEGVAGSEDYTRTVMTYHTSGGHSSSSYLHDAPWLHFNMIQTWASYDAITSMVTADYERTPPKPVVLAEGAYEDGPQYPTGPITAHVIRKQAYWSYFAGGFHTYGNTNVWSFGTYAPEATHDWRRALDSAGAASMSVLRRFFGGLRWWALVPDQSVLAGETEGAALNAAMRTNEGDCVVVYLPDAGTVTLTLDALTAAAGARATWIDPRSGAEAEAGGVSGGRPQAFSTPPGWEDALLRLTVERLGQWSPRSYRG